MKLNNLNKIIIAVPDRLGDNLFCTPSLRLLKQNNHALQIDILAPTELAVTALKYNPHISNIYRKTPSHKYDLAIDISDSETATKLIKEINAKLIAYHDDKTIKLHSAEKLLQFFADFFSLNSTAFPREYQIDPQPQDLNTAAKLLADSDIDPTQHILIGFHLGCHGLSRKRTRLWNKFKHEKAWPLKNFIRLAQKLQRHNNNIRIIITGSAEEEKLAEKFTSKIPAAINLINKTTIHELAAIIDHCKIFVSNDTGVMHLACATKAAVIALFGASSPTATGPYPNSHNHLTIAKPKISSISVATVFQAVLPYLP